MRSAAEILNSIQSGALSPAGMREARYYAEFFSAWAAVTEQAGVAEAAAHSRVANIERGKVIIEVEHPGWKQILQTKQKELLAIISRRSPGLGVTGLSFWLAREPFASGTSRNE